MTIGLVAIQNSGKAWNPMYLVLFRRPNTTIRLAGGVPPETFEFDGKTYTRQKRPLATAIWRVDASALPIAVFCRIVPGERWPDDVMTLPRLNWEGTTLAFWLTNDRNYERRDILCDEFVLYRADYQNYAFAFSLDGIAEPSRIAKIQWPSADI